jgi:hypothetical protein
MRFGIWAYAISVSVTAFGVGILGFLFENIYPWHFGRKPLPAATELFLKFHWWVLLLPIGWVLAAVYLSGSPPTHNRLYAFASVSTLTICLLIVGAAVILLLPFVTLV